MKEKELPIDRKKHAVYTKSAKTCVKKLLRHCYDEKTSEEYWEQIQMQYVEYLKEAPPMAGAKIKVSIYDPILIFAWYVTVPDHPSSQVIQEEIFDCFFGSFRMGSSSYDKEHGVMKKCPFHTGWAFLLCSS